MVSLKWKLDAIIIKALLFLQSYPLLYRLFTPTRHETEKQRNEAASQDMHFTERYLCTSVPPLPTIITWEILGQV